MGKLTHTDTDTHTHIYIYIQSKSFVLICDKSQDTLEA